MAFIKNNFWNIFVFKCGVSFDFDYTDLLQRSFTQSKIKKEFFRDINVFHNGKLRHAFATLAGHKILKKIVAPSLLSLFFCLFELNDCLPARAKRGMAIILPHRTKILNMRGLFEKNIFIKNCGITMERGNSQT